MTASGGGGGGEYNLGTAVLRLYGDRSNLDRELEVLRRYTERLEKQGVTVKFDADTGAATREINGLQQMLVKAKEAMHALAQGMQGNGSAFNGLADSLGKMGGQSGAGAAAAGALGGVAKAAGVAIPLLGQVGLAVMGLEGIFRGATGAINAFLGPFQQLAAEAARFNQQVAQGGIFAANSFGIFGPDGKVVEGTANQMRAVKGVITKEYGEIQKEVAKISGATASEIYEGFNIILQNIDALGEKGADLSNVTKLSTRLAAGMNTLGIPGFQLRSEVNSLLTGDIQMYDQLAQKLGIGRDDVQREQSAGRYYDFLMEKLEKLYEGQKVLAQSLPNVQSNFTDLFQSISSQGGQAMERGMARGLQMVLTTLTSLRESFTMLFRSISEALEPILVIFGQLGAMLTSVASVVSSLLSMVITSLGTVLNLVGTLLSGGLQVLVRALELIAKTVEVVAEAFNRGMRIISTFFRILGQDGTNAVDSQFDKLIGGLDAFADWIEKNQQRMLDPWIAMTQAIIQARGFLQGIPQKEIDQQKAVARTEFQSAFNTSDEYDLRPQNLSRKSETFMDELRARIGGSGSGTRNLEYARQASKIKEDMYRNEIRALQQGVELMQRQKQLAEAMNQLSDARRSLTMQSFNLATQVAASPEAKAAAEGKRDDVALQQEQQRIRERVGLLGIEKSMMQQQLEIQTRQIQIEQEGLKIKRLEQQIEVDKARAVSTELVQKLRNVVPGSAQQRTYQQAFRDVNRELEYRQQIMRALDRSVSMSYEQEAVTKQINGLDMQRLDTQEQMLGVQAQSANYTREQQRLLAEIQAKELRIKNTLDEKVAAQTKLQNDANREIQQLQDQQKSQDELLKIEKARAELGATRAKAATDEAERILGAVQGQDQAQRGGSTRELIEAQIKATAAGVSATETATSATERLYDAKERQMRQEQEAQRRAVQIQQEREASELRIFELRTRADLAAAEIQLLQLDAARANLQLNSKRDVLSQSLAGSASVPGLGAAGGGGLQGLLQLIYAGEGGYTSVNRGTAGDTPGGYPGLTGMTIGQVKQQQAAGRFFAVGAAQFIPATLPVAQRDAGLSDRDMFSPGNQDQMAMALMLGSKRPALAAYLRGESSNLDAAHRELALEWASVPGPSGRGMYDGDSAGNRASGSAARVRAMLQSARGGYRPGGAGGPDMSNAMGLQVGQAVPFGAPSAPVLPGPGGAVPIPVTPFTGGSQSLENQLDANATEAEKLSASIDRLREQIEVITGARSAQLATLGALQNENLSEAEAAQNRAFQFDRAVDLAQRRVLETPQGRLAASTADSVGGAIRGGVSGAANALISGGDPREALAQALKGLASEVLTSTLDALMQPLIAQLQSGIFKAMTGFDPATIQLQAAAGKQMIAAEALMAAAAAFNGPLKGGGLIGDMFSGGAGLSGLAGLTNAVDYSGIFSSAVTGGGLPGFSIAGSLLPGLASGGDMEPGRAYKVGEFGPEVAISGPSGVTVLPTELAVPWMKAGRSGGGVAAAGGRRVSHGSPASSLGAPYQRGAAGRAGAAGRSGRDGSGGELAVPFLRGQDAGGSQATVVEMLATLGGSPIRVESESLRVGDLDVVTSAQHRQGMQTASDQAFYRVVEGLLNNVQLRKKLGVG